jgi:hypothetical protein
MADEKGKYVFEQKGEYVVTVAVSGDGAPTVPIKLKLNWQGDLEAATIEKINDKSATKTLDKLQ